MRAEWGVSLHDALFVQPLNAGLALWPALLTRHGGDPGLSAIDRARQRAKTKARQWIAENYTVIPNAKKGSGSYTLAAPSRQPANGHFYSQ